MKQLEPMRFVPPPEILSLVCHCVVPRLSLGCHRLSLAREVIAFFDLILFLILFNYFFSSGSRSPVRKRHSATFRRQTGDNAATAQRHRQPST